MSEFFNNRRVTEYLTDLFDRAVDTTEDVVNVIPGVNINISDKSNRTAEEEKEKKKFKVKTKILKYPLDVETDIQPHSVVFGIKVREQSKIGKSIAKSAQDAGKTVEFNPSNNNRINGEQADIFKVAATPAATFGAYKLAKTLTGSTLLGAVAGGATAYASANAVGLLGEKNRTVSTGTFITLYVPQSPQAKYSADYQDTDLGALTGLLAQGSSLEDVLTGSSELAGRQLIGAADIGRAIGVDINFGGALQATTKKVANPFKEQLFKTMNFRDFAFEYKFAPRNQTELEAVLKIINEFKIHMHSEKSDNGVFLIYPSEFSIEFRYRGARNTFVQRIADCALTDMKVDYGRDGTLTTFKDTGGAPSEITLQLAFRELEILTRDMVEAGY